MDSPRILQKICAGALLAGGLAVAGVGLAAGPAAADPVPLGASGPYTWCPGEPMSGLHPQTGRGGPGLEVQWDMTHCHTWWGVQWGHGNVYPGVWDGPDPPPPDARQRPPCGFPFMCSGTP
jgi:hypothetical protein